MIKKTDISLFNSVLLQEFNLKTKPIIRVTNRVVFNSELCWGLYVGYTIKKRNYHTIKINRTQLLDNLELFCVLAHEYCHAWQLEKKLEIDHEQSFIQWQEYFNNYYNVNIVLMKDSNA